MIRGTRIGVHVKIGKSGDVTCWRCGQEFNRWSQSVIAGAPCTDCREVLRAEGDLTVWGSRAEVNKPQGETA